MRYAGYLLGAALVACGATSATAQQAILGHIMDRDHIFHHVSERFMSRLDELSGGSFIIAYHPGGDLGDWTSITEQVAQGAVQMTMTWNHSELDPRWDLSVLGFIANDWDSAKAVYGPGSVMEGVYAGIMNDLRMELLGIIPTDFTGFVVRKGLDAPTNFPEDAAGFKMRVPGMPMAIERYNALGFSPVSMSFSEVHTSLQTGAIDGRAYSPPTEVPMFSDVVEAYVFTREHFEHTFWVANKRWFDGLTAEQQNWLTTAADDAVSGSWDLAQAQSADWLAQIEARGVKVIELSPEQLETYRSFVIAAEYPYMENIVGGEIMDQIRAAAGDN